MWSSSSLSRQISLAILASLLRIFHQDLFVVFAQDEHHATDSSILDNGVAMELDSGNFQSMIHKHPMLWLIQFYAPYSEESIRMGPLLGRVAKATAGKMAVGKVDCSRFKPLCTKHGIKRYQTLMYYQDEQFSEYPLPYHDEGSMVRFAERMFAPITVVESLAQAEEIAHEEAQHDMVTFAGYSSHPDFDFYAHFERHAHNHAATSRFVWMKEGQETSYSKSHVIRLETGVTKNRKYSISDKNPSVDHLDEWLASQKVCSVATFHNDQDFAMRVMASSTSLPWILAVGGVKAQVLEDMRSYVSENVRLDMDGYNFGIVDRSWTTLLQPYDIPVPSNDSEPKFIMISSVGYWCDPSSTTIADFIATLKVRRKTNHMDLKPLKQSATGDRGLHWTAELFLDYYPMSLGVVLMLLASLVVLLTNDPNTPAAPRHQQEQQQQQATAQHAAPTSSSTPSTTHRGKKDSVKKSD